MKKRYRGSGGEPLAPSYPNAGQFRRRAVLGAAGAALLAGAPMLGCDVFFATSGVPLPPGGAALDADYDSSPANIDCDDGNKKVFPGNREVPDGLDNDCNGLVDDGLPCDGGAGCMGPGDAGTNDAG